jgi:N-acetylglucosaminyldiphosphoundecaprenol N-acetyl-beta-D-mannosaminyltransferase
MVECVDVLCAGVFSLPSTGFAKVIQPRVPFINTWVDAISLENAVNVVFDAIEARQKLHLVFLNALKVYEIHRDARVGKGMREAELILADGVPVLWACRLFGRPLPERVNGTDLFQLLLRGAEQRGKRVFLLGATQQNLERLVTTIQRRHPKLAIAGWRNGYFRAEDDREVIAEINRTNADILFLGFSSPKKELWANEYKYDLNVPVIQGVGGSFEVVAGIIPRAPGWVQKSGLEWLVRVIREPRRMFMRYARSNSMFVYLVFKTWVRERILRRPPPEAPSAQGGRVHV